MVSIILFSVCLVSVIWSRCSMQDESCFVLFLVVAPKQSTLGSFLVDVFVIQKGFSVFEIPSIFVDFLLVTKTYFGIGGNALSTVGLLVALLKDAGRCVC